MPNVIYIYIDGKITLFEICLLASQQLFLQKNGQKNYQCLQLLA
jgi:hypothetical protein